jgi:hypothetical protein
MTKAEVSYSQSLPQINVKTNYAVQSMWHNPNRNTFETSALDPIHVPAALLPTKEPAIFFRYEDGSALETV